MSPFFLRFTFKPGFSSIAIITSFSPFKIDIITTFFWAQPVFWTTFSWWLDIDTSFSSVLVDINACRARQECRGRDGQQLALELFQCQHKMSFGHNRQEAASTLGFVIPAAFKSPSSLEVSATFMGPQNERKSDSTTKQNRADPFVVVCGQVGHHQTSPPSLGFQKPQVSLNTQT